jgi:hypothetical protein
VGVELAWGDGGDRRGRSPEQVDGWIQSPLRKLTPKDRDDIEEALVKTGAGTGAVKEMR